MLKFMADSGFPIGLYMPVLLNAAVYLYNRLPHRGNPGMKSPFQMRWGTPPAWSMVNRVGCLALFYLTKQQRDKHGFKCCVGWLVGWSETTCAYVVWVNKFLPRMMFLNVVHVATALSICWSDPRESAGRPINIVLDRQSKPVTKIPLRVRVRASSLKLLKKLPNLTHSTTYQAMMRPAIVTVRALAMKRLGS